MKLKNVLEDPQEEAEEIMVVVTEEVTANHMVMVKIKVTVAVILDMEAQAVMDNLTDMAKIKAITVVMILMAKIQEVQVAMETKTHPLEVMQIMVHRSNHLPRILQVTLVEIGPNNQVAVSDNPVGLMHTNNNQVQVLTHSSRATVVLVNRVVVGIEEVTVVSTIEVL